MQLDDKQQVTVRRYLLGQAPPELWSPIEERLLTDSQFYEELLILEDELIDQYLSDELSQAERKDFETHFLAAPERQKKVRFSQTLKEYVAVAGVALDEKVAPREDSSAEKRLSEFEPRKRPFFSFLPIRSPIAVFSLAVAALLVVATVSWIALRDRRSTSPEPGNTLAVVLTPGLGREEGETRRISFAGVDTLQLRLALPSDEYQSYRAELVTSERVRVWAKEDLKPDSQAQAKFITVVVPARILEHDDYQVKLSGRRADGAYEDVGSYQFRAVK